MWMAACFPGDQNSEVIRMQHDCYGDCLLDLWGIVRKHYDLAELILGVQTELGKMARNADNFDHRTLQYVHDMLAASFRYSFAGELQPDLPGIVYDLPYETRIRKQWRQYFAKEMQAIIEEEPTFVRLVIEAALYPNPEAEDRLAETLEVRYPNIRAVRM